MVLRFLLHRLPAAAWLLAGIFFLASTGWAQPQSSAANQVAWEVDDLLAPSPIDGKAQTTVPLVQSGERPSLWLLVEDAGKTLALFDTGRNSRLQQAISTPNLSGEIRISPDGRAAYLAMEGGWIIQYRLPDLQPLARVWTGAGGSTMRLSSDGRWLLVATRDPDGLSLLDAGLRLTRTYPLASLDRKTTGRVGTTLVNPVRDSFIVSLHDIKELWEISWNPKAEPIFDGLVHDYRMGEGVASSGFLGVRRTPLDDAMPHALLAPDGLHVVGTTQPTAGKPPRTELINLNIRRRIRTLDLPDAARAVAFLSNQTGFVAAITADETVAVFDARTWATSRVITLPEPIQSLHAIATSQHRLMAVTVPTADGLQKIGVLELEGASPWRILHKSLKAPVLTAASVEGRQILTASGNDTSLLLVVDADTLQSSSGLQVNAVRGLASIPPRMTRSLESQR